jgi:hypothetical protein
MSATIPMAILSQHLRSLLDARKVVAGVFMAFTFEPEFFEQEIMTLLAGEDLSQEPKLRLLQLQELLRAEIGPIVVYYDQRGLRPDGPARLDVRYVPVRVKTGLFHPKVILLLTDPLATDSTEPSMLVCGVLSANLTKAGWWSNLECAHFESVKPGDRVGFRDDLLRLMNDVRALSGRAVGQEPLDRIQQWLRRETAQTQHVTREGRLRTRLLAGTRSFLGFLEEAGSPVPGCSLEVISPFFDERDSTPLREMIEQLDVRETRVFLPTASDGSAACTPDLFNAVRDTRNTEWARLPDPLLRLGKDANAKPRGVHAKVYRFIRRSDRYEALVVGSHNLTTPAHQKGGNFEASFLLERDVGGAPAWWLEVQKRRPAGFKPEANLVDDENVMDDFVPLQITYDWAAKRSEVRWDGSDTSGALTVSASGSILFTLTDLRSGEWSLLGSADTATLERVLNSTSILTVTAETGKIGTILVQEVGLSRKPSIVISFSIADILAYWSRLTAADRAAYLEAHFQSTIPDDWAAHDLITREVPSSKSFFETFAGIFHGFEMLRQQVSVCLEARNVRKADYLLFGMRHDSLPHIINRVFAQEDQADPVSRYLILLCARQMLREMKRSDAEFYMDRRSEIDGLLQRTLETRDLIRGLSLGDGGEEFVQWFESHFLKRLESSVTAPNA